ncbi:GIY-YIG nuclease family protein [Alkalihalobacillus trypoxylicola]|uniref:Endonuclease n=1 Tax=Alkalihalobacillus trypoxylicola TaxID=519424 RepID=A0A162EMT4_9BACI|nr:GIY-YIG nuclease family protein [Alkalihalobacillus trypoxylicola]KYG33280.1 endonuclease [Alkalihalobacillus trypoxylicola]GAF66537.1 hypothetical protein BTS2_3438 [Bacillus sp. TS-2]
MTTSNHIVYILECADGSWYTGYTNNLERRLKMHENGKGAKYTRGRGPFQLIQTFTYFSKQEALKAEYAFKQLSRKDKERVIKEKDEHFEGTKKL